MSKHTSGPWIAPIGLNSILGTYGEIKPVNGETIAVFPADFDKYEPLQIEANARLIAAAPDMLTALEYIVAWNPKDWNPEKARDLAHVAIAKA